jgi:cyclopropane fatty-acyl-phospholipid synthase-like methyltransferase
MAANIPDPSILQKMRADWDQRARDNAHYFIATANEDWSEEEFFESGRMNVSDEVLTDMGNVCQGKDPKQMKVLEIGCGAGRITRALAEIFGEVYAVDVSGEMVERARHSLRDVPNAHVFQNSGADLRVLGDIQFDFAFSFIVFQHIPSHAVIESYLHDVHRVLREGALFKFQVQGGDLHATSDGPDTWLGVHFSESDARALAERTGFEPRYLVGAGTQYFWLWFFRQASQAGI